MAALLHRVQAVWPSIQISTAGCLLQSFESCCHSQFGITAVQVWPLLGDSIPAATLLHRVQAVRPSLGASGAVIALFALVAARQSDRQVRSGHSRLLLPE